MIDPVNITDFSRTDSELEELWLFVICVAGKPALRTALNLHNLLNDKELLPKSELEKSPFKKVKYLLKNELLKTGLKKHGLGQYTKISKAFQQTVRTNINLRKVSVEELELIHGVGPKTSRFFILHTRPNQRHAVLDTHILKFLREKGHPAPKGTPSGKKYFELEEIFLLYADQAGMPIAEYDLILWRKYSGHEKKV